MNAIFALALLASPLRAGVVAPVESAVAPAGPTATAVPVLTPSVGGTVGLPSAGAGLVGALPVLPAPVPGLLPSAHRFVGETHGEAAAIQSQAAQAVPGKAAPVARPARAADRTPALPAEPSPGAPRPAIALDGKPGSPALSNAPAGATLETEAIERAPAESAAGLGRAFFDQSSEKRRGTLDEKQNGSRREDAGGSASATGEAGLAGDSSAGGFASGSAARRSRLKPAGAAFAGADGSMRTGSPADEARQETLHDAVAAVPGAAPAGAAVMYRSAAPNGALLPGAPEAAVPAPGAPRQLSMDLSGTPSLIVRFRAALNGAAASVRPEAPAPAPRVPGPSTALLERGAMLEAFSTAGNIAARSADPAVSALQAAYDAARAPRREVPAPVTQTAPLWWAWLFLPLFVAAARGVL